MRRVLIAWEIGGNLGHLGRLLPIATELVARGYSVSFAVPEGARSANWLRERAWSVVEIPRGPNTSYNDRAASWHGDWFLQSGFGDVAATVDRLKRWTTLMLELKPDLVLLDYAPFVTYASHALSIDYFVLGTGFCVPSQFDKPTYFRPWDKEACTLADLRQQTLNEKFVQLRRMFSAKCAQNFSELFAASHVKMCTYAELDHFPNRRYLPEYLGATWSDFGADQSIKFSTISRQKALCYVNGEEGSYLATIQALLKLNLEVIAIAPKMTKDSMLRLSDPRLTVTSNPINLKLLVEQSDVLISHGGLGFVARGLVLKKKIFLLPLYAEQLILSRRLIDQGLAGATLEFNNSATLSRRIRNLLDEQPIEAGVSKVPKLAQFKSTAAVASLIVENLIAQ